MKTLIAALAAVALVVPVAAKAAEPTLPEAQATYAEARKMLGVVPAALRATPDEQVTALWTQIKVLEMNPSTAVNAKTKELIGLGVAAQIPCAYCIYFHQEAAKLNGANEKELREAVAVAAQVRQWATIVDSAPSTPSKPSPVAKELESTYADIKTTMGGTVPEFFYRFPQIALAPAWSAFKTSLMGSGSIAPKDRALLAAAVSAQIPSTPCVNTYVEMAKKMGATDQEVSEAIGISALTRAGSTVLNGAGFDLVAFKKEVDGIVKHVKKEMGKQVAGR
jgi:AhpD family alkylhydroperoxidase